MNESPDVVINVVDASNLERNLYLTTQLIDMDIKVILALNMYDELEKKEQLSTIKSFPKCWEFLLFQLLVQKVKE